MNTGFLRNREHLFHCLEDIRPLISHMDGEDLLMLLDTRASSLSSDVGEKLPGG